MTVNKVILVGYLGKGPETRYTTAGECITNVSLATSESWKDKDGVKQEKTEWHNLVFYKKIAEIAGKHLNKGSLIYIEGKIQTRKWQDKKGENRYTTEVIVSVMKMLGGKQEHTPKEVPQEVKNAVGRDSIQQAPDPFDDDAPF